MKSQELENTAGIRIKSEAGRYGRASELILGQDEILKSKI